MTTENWITLLIALIASTPGILALVYQREQRSKSKAEAEGVAVETAVSLIAPLRAEMAILRNKIKALEDDNCDLRDWAERLVRQVRSMGQEPVKMRVRDTNVQGQNDNRPGV